MAQKMAPEIEFFDDDFDEHAENRAESEEIDVQSLTDRFPPVLPASRLLRDARRKLSAISGKRVSQPQMAEWLGVSTRTYKSYELGDVGKIPVEVMQKLVKGDLLSAEEVLTGRYERHHTDAAVDDVLDLLGEIQAHYHRDEAFARDAGLQASLSNEEMRAVIKYVLGSKSDERWFSGDAREQVDRVEIDTAVRLLTTYYDDPRAEYSTRFDPEYLGCEPFLCPVMKLAPELRDMKDFERYYRLRKASYVALSARDRAIYDRHLPPEVRKG